MPTVKQVKEEAKDLLKLCQKHGKENIKRASGTQNFFFIMEDNTIHTCFAQPCYGVLWEIKHPSKYWGTKKQEMVGFVSYFSPLSKGKDWIEMATPYINWVIKDSKFADAFLPGQDAESALECGMAMDVSKPANWVIGALQTVRLAHNDNFTSLPLWHRIRDMGFDEDMSDILANYLYFIPKGVKETKETIQARPVPDANGHRPTSFANMSLKDVNKYYYNQPREREFDVPFSENCGFKHPSIMWYKDTNYSQYWNPLTREEWRGFTDKEAYKDSWQPTGWASRSRSFFEKDHMKVLKKLLQGLEKEILNAKA